MTTVKRRQGNTIGNERKFHSFSPPYIIQDGKAKNKLAGLLEFVEKRFFEVDEVNPIVTFTCSVTKSTKNNSIIPITSPPVKKVAFANLLGKGIREVDVCHRNLIMK